MAKTIQIRALIEDEIALITAGLELLKLQGKPRAQMLAASMLEQKMPENMLWISHE
jgi:hypothetical protein